MYRRSQTGWAPRGNPCPWSMQSGSHVVAAERIHAVRTTSRPVLAKGKTRTGRLWTYVRDDRPFAGPDPPAAVFFYLPDRGGEHPEQHWQAMPG